MRQAPPEHDEASDNRGKAARMSFRTLGSVVSLALLAVALVLTQFFAEHPKLDRPAACADETRLLDRWKGEKLILQARPSGENVDLVVNAAAWADLSMPVQLEIGKAVYCPLAAAGKGGTARIEDQDGNALAHMVGDKWSLTPSRKPE